MDITLMINEIGKRIQKTFSDCPITRFLPLRPLASALPASQLSISMYLLFLPKRRRVWILTMKCTAPKWNPLHKIVINPFPKIPRTGRPCVLLIDDFPCQWMRPDGTDWNCKRIGSRSWRRRNCNWKGFQGSGQCIRDMGVPGITLPLWFHDRWFSDFQIKPDTLSVFPDQIHNQTLPLLR